MNLVHDFFVAVPVLHVVRFGDVVLRDRDYLVSAPAARELPVLRLLPTCPVRKEVVSFPVMGRHSSCTAFMSARAQSNGTFILRLASLSFSSSTAYISDPHTEQFQTFRMSSVWKNELRR